MPKAPQAVEKVACVTFSKVPWPPSVGKPSLATQGFLRICRTLPGGAFARLPAPSAQPIRRAGGRTRPGGGRRRLAAGGLWPPACQTKWLGRGTLAPAPAICGRFAPCRRPPRLANRQTSMRAGAAGPALCALRPPYSSGQTYRPLPLVFSPYWMAWTGQRLMQLVQR